MKKAEVKKTHHSALTMSIAGLRFCGIWHLESSTSRYLKFFHNLSNIFGSMVLIILISTIIADLVLNLNDLLIVTDNGCYLAGLSVILYKIYKFRNSHVQIRDLIKAIYDPIRNFEELNDPNVLTILKDNTFYENLGFTFFTCMGSVLMIVLIFLIPTNEGELPIRAAYPFDTSVSPMHELTFIVQIYAIAYGVTSILLMDTIGLGFMRWINVQLIILTSNYQNCTPRSYSSNRDCSSKSLNTVQFIENHMNSYNVMNLNKDSPIISVFVPFTDNEFENMNDNFTSRFKHCVINQKRLTDINNNINALLSSSMLMQLFSSFAMICFTGFQAVLGAKEKSNLMKFVIYLGAAFTQLLYWCWYGNELLYQKHSLIAAQWMSGWENHLNSTSKILITMSMMRTMQPFELKAGGFFIMSMETFVAVVKSSYSFFALLTTVTSDGE